MHPGKVTAEIVVPPDATAGNYSVDVIADDGAGQSALPLAVQVQAEVDSGVGVKADFPSLRGDPGTAFSYTLTVTNNTPESQTFTFTAEGPQGWTVTASPVAAANANTVTVDADGTAQVKVSATPPDGVAEGKYPINVTIASDSGASGSFQLTAEVTGSSKLAVATADQRLNFSGQANSEKRVTLVVGNSGTAAVDAVQFAATPPSGWTVTFDPPKVDEVKPNETTQVVAVIKPAKNALAGDYAIGVRASAGSQAVDPRPALRREGLADAGDRRHRDHRLRVPRTGLAVPPSRSTVTSMTWVDTPPMVDDAPVAEQHAIALETSDLTKHYAERTAVDSLSLQIRRGEIFGLLGPNGAGKTTTILMLLGLTEPSSGTARVDGLDPRRDPLAVKRRVGYLPDDVGFYDDATARENLQYTARLNRLGENRGDGADRVLARAGRPRSR